jgi:hypothetical protein
MLLLPRRGLEQRVPSASGLLDLSVPVFFQPVPVLLVDALLLFGHGEERRRFRVVRIGRVPLLHTLVPVKLVGRAQRHYNATLIVITIITVSHNRAPCHRQNPKWREQ